MAMEYQNKMKNTFRIDMPWCYDYLVCHFAIMDDSGTKLSQRKIDISLCKGLDYVRRSKNTGEYSWILNLKTNEVLKVG